MELKRVVLPFDKEEISLDELREHQRYYRENALIAMEKVNDRQFQLELAKHLRALLGEEYHYYNLVRVEKVIWKKKEYMTYDSYVRDVFANCVGRLTKNNADSFLYNAKSYATFHKI